ncbi:S-adenosyl-L-methionine-dependent methyltransferase [Halteromyces radiatus]|uniref:S-adenosyl-L-methionine-dependent methyltransferase n=1 Tax=Halteromyces radiatus TaxID=101107 RepID=UPI00221F3D04|nr:S-adenosyl-L-methionine-dependent methyltransferase [Halteromyces radiatus]KAI8098600.1 S-adenosyl-L-methionine-dependent methyltransferase [Halteromyces radiatus]
MSIPRLPSIRELIKLYGLSARSQLSQNFILDKNITDKIVRCASLSESTPLVVEVGPGPGLLTRSILDAGIKNLVAQLAEASEDRLKVIQGNMLELSHQTILDKAQLDTSSIGTISPLHIMGNLPFNIATPLLLQWLHLLAGRQGIFGVSSQGARMTLMFQKEVGDRLIAKESTNHRGRLAIMAQSLCDVQEVYHVPASVFVPKPKVDASVIQLMPKMNMFDGQQDAYLILENILRYYFTKRRKTVGHITRRLMKEMPESKSVLAELEDILDFKARPEDLTTNQFCQVAKHLYEHSIVELPL